jgi:hypothetical protein
VIRDRHGWYVSIDGAPQVRPNRVKSCPRIKDSLLEAIAGFEFSPPRFRRSLELQGDEPVTSNLTVTGTVLYAPEGPRLVAEDGSLRLRRLTVSDAAAGAISMASGAGDYASFLDRIRFAPMTTVKGTFSIASADSAPLVTIASNLRPASDEEVRAAIKADLQLSIDQQQADGCVPQMSAEELMELTRGNDEDAVTSSPRP